MENTIRERAEVSKVSFLLATLFTRDEVRLDEGLRFPLSTVHSCGREGDLLRPGFSSAVQPPVPRPTARENTEGAGVRGAWIFHVEGGGVLEFLAFGKVLLAFRCCPSFEW